MGATSCTAYCDPARGGGSAFELGTIVEADGSYRGIREGEVSLEALDWWDSPKGGTYPSRWRFQIPSEGLDLEITPYISEQELDAIVRYWEGAVKFEGTAEGERVNGSGYVEMNRIRRLAFVEELHSLVGV